MRQNAEKKEKDMAEKKHSARRSKIRCRLAHGGEVDKSPKAIRTPLRRPSLEVRGRRRQADSLPTCLKVPRVPACLDTYLT